MPKLGPISRKDLIQFLKKLKFEGPYSGGKHQFMIKGETILRLPNHHKKQDIGKELLTRILKQAGIDRHKWEKL